MWLSVPMMFLKSVLRSFSASPGGKAATPSKITLSAQALYWASILTVLVPTIWQTSRCGQGAIILGSKREQQAERQASPPWATGGDGRLGGPRSIGAWSP